VGWWRNPVQKVIRKTHVNLFETLDLGHPARTYVPSPFKGIERSLLDLPTRAVTRFATGVELEPTRPVRFLAMGLGGGYIISREVEKYWDEVLAKRKEQVFKGHRETYIKLLNTDYRYNSIRLAFEAGRYSLDQALILVENHRQMTLGYHEFMNHGFYEYADETDAQIALLNSEELGPLFADVKNLVVNGLPESLNYDYSYREQQYGSKQLELTNNEIQELMKLKHYQLLANAVIPDLVKGTSQFESMRADPIMGNVLSSIQESNFAKGLFVYHKNKIITDDELIYLLTEEMHHQFMFRGWQMLGVSQMTTTETGAKKRLTLANVHKITMNAIEARVNGLVEQKNIGELPICPASPVVVKP
jgi:hypothetical protein